MNQSLLLVKIDQIDKYTICNRDKHITKISTI